MNNPQLRQLPKHLEKQLEAYDESMQRYYASGDAGISGGNRTWPGGPTGAQQPRFRGGGAEPSGAKDQKAGDKGCPGDETSPSQGGICVCGPNECDYDPAIFCGWSYLPFATYKSQGTDEFTGPVPGAPGGFPGQRIIQITSERACFFRVRSLWCRSVNTGTATIGITLIQNVLINEVPRPLEVGTIDPARRIGLPSSLFDGSLWTLPVNWGILSPINNNSRPLELQLATPLTDDQDFYGVLFGDALGPDSKSLMGDFMMNY